jgi:hypothetical protein
MMTVTPSGAFLVSCSDYFIHIFVGFSNHLDYGFPLSSLRAHCLIVVFEFTALMAIRNSISGVALGFDYGRNFRCPRHRVLAGATGGA